MKVIASQRPPLPRWERAGACPVLEYGGEGDRRGYIPTNSGNKKTLYRPSGYCGVVAVSYGHNKRHTTPKQTGPPNSPLTSVRTPCILSETRRTTVRRTPTDPDSHSHQNARLPAHTHTGLRPTGLPRHHPRGDRRRTHHRPIPQPGHGRRDPQLPAQPPDRRR